ncbi:MAG: hypothetical protein GY803_05035 [Chloroflexi bacterium]|nr:hypothetical protein [Chloroflexota bacterium]
MMKITATTVKWTGIIAFGTWLITILGFIFFIATVEPTLSQSWAKSVATGLVNLIAGMVAFVTSLVYSIAAWSMSAEEHYEMFIGFRIFGRPQMNKSHLHWQNRVIMLLGLPMGMFFIIQGITELAATINNLPH